MKKKLDKYLEEALYNLDLPGLCFSVRKGDFNYKKVGGYRNYVTKEPLQVGDAFHMCSVSKLFTATAILKLCEAKKISLDDKITKVLPWISINDSRFKEVTLKQMVTHTSGMADVEDYGWDKPEVDENALKRYATSDEVKNSKLLWSPDENKFQYSNMAYEILGCVVAEVSGVSFEDFIKREIFEPLKMFDSEFLTFKRDGENMADPHKKNEEKQIVLEKHYPYNRAHGPSSTLTTNAYDIEKWAIANINRTILESETYDILWKEYAVVPNNGEKMGIGWFMRDQNGYKLMGHEGTDDGFRASFWICPELDCHISVMTNISKGSVKRINKNIFNIITEK